LNNLIGRKLSVRILSVLLLIGAGQMSCSSNTPSGGPGRGGSDGGPDSIKRDAGSDVACLAAAAPRKTLGSTCGCDSDCDSGFCIDGVCCASACQETCKACNVPGMMGTCTFVPTGLKPRDPATCKKSEVATCGLDGTCDGNGACRQYPAGTVCLAGTCDGAAVSGINVCTGNGRCLPGSLKICVPYTCNQAQKDCAAACTTSADCSTGHACVAGSCGAKPKGAVCTKDDDCEGKHCHDGVCCESSCQGACVSCNLVGHEGTCWPIAAGLADPRGVCKDSGAASCGQTGSCDGMGNCDKYSRGTVCSPPLCSGDRLLTAATCDGQGACSQPDVNECPPYRCINGACKVPCATDTDCQPGHACVNGSCGPKQPGQACAANSECASNFCVDGVCCTEACQGACRSCALPSSKGRCTNLPDGSSDSRNVCRDMGAGSCKTDGRCDGGGGCRIYKKDTPCAGESCNNNVYVGPSACDGTGTCVAPRSQSCAPFACNGNKCFDACTQDKNCVPPNVCNGNSCGKKMNGASCNNGPLECISQICAQGICCATACDGVCKSCALTNSRGTCTNLPAGQADSTNTCVDQGAASCGNNGKCEAGGCQKYAKGTSCKDPTCPPNTTTFTARATCDGAGTCVTPAATSCVPYKCGVAACKATCTADADCSTGQVCTNGSCGLKPPGGSCSSNSECQTGLTCAQGVCCNSACSGACVSCTLPGMVGMCKPVPANTADARCVDTGAASCGNNGKCDGAGACQKYPAGTQCLAASCPTGTSTVTTAKTCDGKGACNKGGTMSSCGSFLCNPATNDCFRNCGTTADCLPPNLCDPKNNICGNKKPAGQACANTGECQTDLFCTDGVCCTSNACGTCQSCNVGNSAGSCANVAPGANEPHNMCPAQNPLVCGQTGKCDGNGMCSNQASGTVCGMATCSGSMFTAIGMCSGTGTCSPGSTVDCQNYACTTTGCKVSCQSDNDCAAGKICSGGVCGAKKANGGSCTRVDGSECMSGNCVDGTCCGTSSCGACNTCAGTGTCHAVGDGTTDSKCPVQNSNTCGTNGTCQAGACAKYPDGTSCGAAMCSGNTLIKAAQCAGGTCSPATQPCGAYKCDPAGCRNPCGGDGDCVNPGDVCNAGVCEAPPPPPDDAGTPTD